MSAEKRTIYCFNNGGAPDWLYAVALGDDGQVVGQHVCSHEHFMKNDLGITSDWKHDKYNAAYGEGNWQLVWVPTEGLSEHAGLKSAIKLAEEKQKSGTQTKFGPNVVIEMSDGTKIER